MTTRGTEYWKNGTIPLIGPDILGDIIAEVADIAIVLTEKGEVLSILSNTGFEPAMKLSGLEGRQFIDVLTTESVPKFRERLESFVGGNKVRPVELNHSDEKASWEYPIRYSFHQVGPDGAVLLLGTDLRPVAEMQQQLVKAQLALERDYEAQREYDTRFKVLMHSSTEPHFFVSTSTGKITEANSAAALLLGVAEDSLSGVSFGDFFEVKGATNLVEVLSIRALDGSNELKAQTAATSLAVILHPTLFRVSGERTLLCRVNSDDIGTPVLDGLPAQLKGMHDQCPDGIVFFNETGKVLSTNDGFLDLLGLGNGIDVRGQMITDFLQRGSVDLKVMTENASRFGRMRLYATKIASNYGSPRSVEMSVTTITAGSLPVFALIMRDANRSDNGHSKPAAKSDDVQSVVELVGSATLKEIVAESTNVIERMCIETAIELTMNNRVAAAEMLGLSRQSLYVKLRKLNLIARGD